MSGAICSPMPWLTPNTAPTDTQCRRLFIPDDETWIAAVSGALLQLTRDYNWEEHGTLTPEEAAERAQTMFLLYLDDECPPEVSMLGMVVPYSTATPPTDTLACDGATYANADYPEYVAVMHSAWIVDSTHFKVPDLRSRMVIGTGAPGGGFSTRSMGNQGGWENATLTLAEMPAHTHTYQTKSGTGSATINAARGATGAPDLAPTTSSAGSGSPHSIMNPYTALGYCVVVR